MFAGSHQNLSWDISEAGKKKEESEAAAVSLIKRKNSKKCSDLIVLGLPWKSVEEDLRKYFSQFGELLMVQVGVSQAFSIFNPLSHNPDF